MGYNLIFLPDAKALRKRVKQDRETTIKWLKRADCYIGSESAQKLVKELTKTKIDEKTR